MIKRLIQFPILLISITAAVASLLIVLCAYIPPKPMLSIFGAWNGLFFAFCLLHFGLLIFWLVRGEWKWAIIPLVALAASTPLILSTISINPKPATATPDRQTLRVTSYNVGQFQFFNKKIGKNTVGALLLDKLAEDSADIVCLQEFGFKEYGKHDESFVLRKLRSYPYHFCHTPVFDYNFHKGLAIFSKHPIVAEHVIDLGSTYQRAIATDIKVGNDTIRVFTAYLQSNKLNASDKDFKLEDWKDKLRLKLTVLSQKLDRAAKPRVRQAAKIKAAADQSPYPVIIAGDLNDLPASYTYHLFKNGYKDLFLEAGKGFGSTCSIWHIGIRIDYIFADPRFDATSFTIGEMDYSDHRPIHCELFLK